MSALPVLGVDPSLKATGVGLLIDGRVTTTLIEATVMPGVGGIREGVRYTVGKVLRFAPAACLSVVEAPILPRHGGGLALERAWLYGMLIDQLMLRGPVATVHPSTRALYATGYGKADKAQVVKAINAAFPDLGVKNDNIADGVALMAMGARWQGRPVDGQITSKQAKAMRSAHWPIGGTGEEQ